MRIYPTNYYTHKKLTYVKKNGSIRAEFKNAYALVVSGKSNKQIMHLLSQLSQSGIRAIYKPFVEFQHETYEIPTIQITEDESIKKLEDQFTRQHIVLDPDRFQKRTNWDDVLEHEESKKTSMLDRLNKALCR